MKEKILTHGAQLYRAIVKSFVLAFNFLTIQKSPLPALWASFSSPRGRVGDGVAY
jgi:hypothetical protein